MNSKNQTIENSIQKIDKELSERFISLDPKGYFLIHINLSSNEIVVEHYSNVIDKGGIALNPETGEPLKCQSQEKRSPMNLYKGKTAKELGIQLTEGEDEIPISRLDHALYLGRELQKAEECLKSRITYIQD